MEDVLLFAAGLLADDERVAAQVRRQYKRFVVDEFQDVSPLQSALLDLWLGGRDELCVVGDPAQTIYSFAGARADHLIDFPAKFPGTTSIDLVRNYRSTPAGRRGRQPAAGRHHQPGRRAARAAAGRPRGGLRRPPRRGGRGRRHRRPGAEPGRHRHALRPDGRAVPDQRPVRGARGGADRARHPLRRARRGPLLRPPRGAAGGHAAAGHGPLGGARGRPGRHRPGDAVRPGLDDGGARRRADRSATAGSPGRRWSTRRPSTPGPRAPTSTASSTSSTAAPPSSTHPSPTGSRSPPSTPPRASSGTPCCWPGSRTARCRSPTPRVPPSSRRSGGSSTSA